jgi:DNA-binding NarL/FixJ family response regulator
MSLCPACDARPRIGVAITHPAMRELVSELLRRDLGSEVTVGSRSGDDGVDGVVEPLDLLIIDEVAFTDAFRAGALPEGPTKVIVVGPEQDPSYREFAFSQGADAWVVRDRVAEELRAQSRRLLGCIHVAALDHWGEP